MFSLLVSKRAHSVLSGSPILRRVFYADLVAQFGEVSLWVVFPLFVLDATHDVALSGAALGGEILAFGLVSQWAGNLADQRCPRAVMLWGAGFRLALLTLLLGGFSGSLSVAAFLGFSLLLGAAGAFFVPAKSAFIRRLVGGEDLAEIVATTGALAFFIRMFAPALMGTLLALMSARAGLVIDAFCYLIVLVLLRPDWVKPREVVVRELGSDWRAGWRWLLGSPQLRWLAGYDFWLTVLCMASFSSSLALLVEHFSLPARYNGWLMAANGLAGALGARLAHRLPSQDRVFPGLTLLLAASCALASQAGSLMALLGLWGLRGLGVGVMVVKIEQRIALATPPEAMGRVQAAWALICCLGAFLGTMVAPPLLKTVGAVGAFQAFALVFAAIAVAGAYSQRKR